MSGGVVEPGHTAASFQSTLWALVLGARGDRHALEQLLRAYWAPVYAFIRRQGYSGHDASDLTQEFLSQVVIGRDMVGRANPERGRFRAFLKQALRNFLIDQHRLGRVSKGSRKGPGGPPANSNEHGGRAWAAELEAAPMRSSDSKAPLLDSVAPAERASTSTRPAQFSLDSAHFTPAMLDEQLASGGEFDREWAAALIERTLNVLEEACRADGMDAHWLAFSMNVLGPTLRKTNPIPLEKLVALTGATDAMQVSNMLQTMKRRFRRTLREVVRETVADSIHVEDELAELKRYFGSE
ncbi:MAG: sigma-70 family RNA polymerase sigma factor [Phycisphaerales bacterium]|nr:sigma-70 family RNA polymerase sigma factor [Phycisphaerales bacterium]